MGILQNQHLSVSSLGFEMLEIPKPRLFPFPEASLRAHSESKAFLGAFAA